MLQNINCLHVSFQSSVFLFRKAFIFLPVTDHHKLVSMCCSVKLLLHFWNGDTLISEAGRHGWCELEVRQCKLVPFSDLCYWGHHAHVDFTSCLWNVEYSKCHGKLVRHKVEKKGINAGTRGWGCSWGSKEEQSRPEESSSKRILLTCYWYHLEINGIIFDMVF